MRPQARRRLANAVTLVLILAAASLAVAAAILALVANSNEAVRYGATAAGLSVVVIGLQAWETRRASEAAERALHQSQAAIVVSEQTALEAAKTRLDARTPTVMVSIQRPDWPPARPPQYQFDPPTQLSVGDEFRLPRDETALVMLEAEGLIRNESQVSILVTTSNLCLEGPPKTGASGVTTITWEYPPTTQERHLSPGAELPFRLREARPVSAWVENFETGSSGRSGPNIIGAEIIFSDPFDNGIVDNWRLELTGRPLEPVPAVASAYRVPMVLGEPPIAARVRPIARRYYHSKSSDTQFTVP
jgi:hypothetical protein